MTPPNIQKKLLQIINQHGSLRDFYQLVLLFGISFELAYTLKTKYRSLRAKVGWTLHRK